MLNLSMFALAASFVRGDMKFVPLPFIAACAVRSPMLSLSKKWLVFRFSAESEAS